MAVDFSARDQTLGYLYQARYALYLLLSSNEEQELILEGLDDVVFEDHGNPQELLQLKHHSKASSLTNSIPELWKTMRVWSEHVANGTLNPRLTSFTLITTAVAPENSISAKLRPGENRDPSSALEELISIAQTSGNISLETSFNTFLNLENDQRKALVNSIYILDHSTNIQDTTDLIKNIIKVAVAREHRDGLYERLEGWWFGKVVSHLRSDAPEPISGFEVNDRIRSIAAQFLPDALPIDYLEAEPEIIDPTSDSRLFITQLKMISVQNPRIEKAIIDYYRAFEQRSRWVREDLLIGDELEKYENKLVDEWERLKLAITDDDSDEELPEPELQRIGRNIYNWMEQTADYKIRQNVTEPYVMRGSYHILANNNPPRVWWHPKFIERLTQLLSRSS